MRIDGAIAGSGFLLAALITTGCSGSHAAVPDGSGGDVGSAGGPGVAGVGGASGSGGTGVAGGSGAVRIIRGDPSEPNWFSLTIEGRGLADDEGKIIFARIGMPERPPERLGSGQARIQNGAFRIEFPEGCEGFLYKRKVLFIDVDGDGSCTPGVDRVYSDFRFLESDITLTLADSVPPPATDRQMLLSSTDPPAGSNCQALNETWPDS